MKKYMVLQYLNTFSPILKEKTDSLEDATALRDALTRINPENIYIIVEVLA